MSASTAPVETISAPESTEAATAVEPATVWGCVIEHDYGTDLSLHATEDAAKAHRRSYVTEWWETELGEDLPDGGITDDDVVRYFEQVGNEGAIIRKTKLPA